MKLPMSSQAIVTVMAKHDFSFVFLGQLTNTEIKVVKIKLNLVLEDFGRGEYSENQKS